MSDAIRNLVVIEDHGGDDGVEWLLSFSGPNNDECIRCYSKEDAYRLLDLIKKHFG